MSENNDWILVDMEGGRPPQLNTANMSSNQVADTNSAIVNQLNAAMESKLTLTIIKNACKLDFKPDHAPLCSVTDHTENLSATTDQVNDTVAATASKYTSVASKFKHTAALTKENLESYNHQISQFAPGDMASFMNGDSVFFTELMAMGVNNHERGHVSHSHISLDSDRSYQLIMSPDTDASCQFVGAGARFDDHSTNRTPILGISDRE